MVNARCIALALLGYNTCGRAFVLRPRVASTHVINKPHGFVGLKQRPTCSRRALGTRTTAVVASAAEAEGNENTRGVRSTEDALSPPGEVGAVKSWDVLPAGVAAAVAGVALAGGLLHPELANAADSFGERRVLLFWPSCTKSVFAVVMLSCAPLDAFCVALHVPVRSTWLYNSGEERAASPTHSHCTWGPKTC